MHFSRSFDEFLGHKKKKIIRTALSFLADFPLAYFDQQQVIYIPSYDEMN